MDIVEIIETAGGLTKLGRAAGVDYSTVAYWRKAGKIPAERARRIHDALGIPLHEIRPDLWRPDEARRVDGVGTEIDAAYIAKPDGIAGLHEDRIEPVT